MNLVTGALLIAIILLTTMETLLIINGYKLRQETLQYMEDNCPELDDEMRKNLVEGAMIDMHTSIILILVLLIVGFYLVMTGVM